MYIADLHIHSKYSRATSKDCVPEMLDLWARRKGINLVGTGDFTHYAWREELYKKLVPMEEGLYVLNKEFAVNDDTVNNDLQTRFVVTGEISSIYKKNGKVRKIHNLIILPSIEDAEKLSKKLELIGNIHSDGRPILGIDSRNLLEITLESCPEAIFIPAHIWTPHFSLFGAFSGFDSIEECFEDLTPHIYALETGLSSDPAMNWRISALDNYTLISNSDAHSPSKLGREANIFDTDLSYIKLSEAIRNGKKSGFKGTIEFFPEEGKYHFDGHRNCNICFAPEQTNKNYGKCPVCGKLLTIGVQNRVEQLADRPDGYKPNNAAKYESIMPLIEVIGSTMGLTSASKKVNNQYNIMLRELGSEFYILRDAPLNDIGNLCGEGLQEGIKRMREGKVIKNPGYDGRYGKIELFSPSELSDIQGQLKFFAVSNQKKCKSEKLDEKINSTQNLNVQLLSSRKQHLSENEQDRKLEFNKEQLDAITSPQTTISVIAGPGTGKTKTLIARIENLIKNRNISPKNITAVTFTNKAANEIRHRLKITLKNHNVDDINIGTFHSICLNFLRKFRSEEIVLIDEFVALEIANDFIGMYNLKCSAKTFLNDISRIKNNFTDKMNISMEIFNKYCKKLNELKVIDFDDLLLESYKIFKNENLKSEKFDYVLVDEFQDINEIQYNLIANWKTFGKELFVIGDPNQSIYGFRGASSKYFEKLKIDFSEVKEINLIENYRNTPEILDCALNAVSRDLDSKILLKSNKIHGDKVRIVEAQSELSEGIYITKEIINMIHGADMLDTDNFTEYLTYGSAKTFSDIAILYRTHRQSKIIEKCLKKEGIPYTIAGKDDLLNDRSAIGVIGFLRFLTNPKDILSLRLSLCNIFNFDSETTDLLLSEFQKLGFTASDFKFLESLFMGHKDFEKICLFLNIIKKSLKYVEKNSDKIFNILLKSLDKSMTESIKKLFDMTKLYNSLNDFLQNLLTGNESDILYNSAKKYTADAVHLMTLHAAKGLEFPVVFLCGASDKFLPLNIQGNIVNSSEEKNLLYVGMTRAKEYLIISYSENKSLFLNGLPSDLCEIRGINNINRPLKNLQLSFFK